MAFTSAALSEAKIQVVQDKHYMARLLDGLSNALPEALIPEIDSGSFYNERCLRQP